MKPFVVSGLLAGALCVVACTDQTFLDDESIVAVVAGEPIHLNEVNAYFDANLIEVEGEEPSHATAEVKSRLLDALIEERLLAAEAEELGIEVTALEIEAYLDFGAVETIDTERDPGRTHREARRRLMVQKVQEQVLRELDPLSDEEVARHVEEHRDRLLPERRIELRALQLGSSRQAERIYNEIRRRRMTFQEAVIAHERSPGQSGPRRVSWENLSEEVRQALDSLKPGQVSKPIEIYGEVYLFQIGSWLREPDDREVELTRRAREELEAVHRQQALADLIGALRERRPVRILFENLPFDYSP